VRSAAATRTAAAAASARTAAGNGLLMLSILFWLIFWQNLPQQPFAVNAPAHVQAHAPGGNADSGGGGNVTDRILKVGMLSISLYVIVRRMSLARALAKQLNGGMVAVLGLALLSAAWSFDPNSTVLRWITLANIALTSFAIALAGWHRVRLQQLAIPPLMLIMLVSLVAGLFIPDQMKEPGTDISQLNAWHGILSSKNEFGMVASIGVILCANRLISREGQMVWALVGGLIAGTCLILSRSNTSEFATAVAVGSMAMWKWMPVIRQRFAAVVGVGIAAVLLVYELAIQNLIPGVSILLAPLVGLTGKDMTFSARSIIWDVVKQHMQYAPYLGTGYGAYWLGPFPGSPSYVFVPMMNFYPTEAHNGYLDIINDLGYVGLICVLIFVFRYVRQALQLMRFDPNQAALYLALLFQQMVMNMSESEWFSRSSTFAILILSSVCLSRALLDVQQRRPQQQMAYYRSR
jgi:O-antigen ligase